MAVTAPGVRSCRSFHFSGGPEAIISATVDEAVAMLAEALQSRFADSPTS